jgi:hypothetical protein
MNERIKELAKPYLMYERFSRYGESTEEEYYDFLPEELDEFVKLIAREILSYSQDDGDLDFMKFMIKKNFGEKDL